MGLTKIKRKELKRGDMFCAPYEKGVSEVYVVTLDGDDVIDSISNMEVFQIDVPRIGLPDYTHELTQFSWKLKALDDWTKECNVRIDEIEQKLHPHVDSEVAMHNVLKSAFGDLYRRVDEHNTIDERDERIEELETRLTGCRQAKESLQGIVETQLSKIEELESHEGMIIGNLRAINMRLHKTMCKQDKRIKEQDEWFKAQYQNIVMLKDRVDDRDNKIETLGTKLAECHDKFVGRGDDPSITRMQRHIGDLKGLHATNIRTWGKRESDRLQMVEGRDADIARMQTDLELLDEMLKIVNPLLRTGAFVSTNEHKRIVFKMFELYQVVNQFRWKHNIVG